MHPKLFVFALRTFIFLTEFFFKNFSCYSTPDSFNSLTPDSWEAILVLVFSYKLQKDMLTFVSFSKSFENTLNSPLGLDSPSFNVSWALNELLYQRRGFAFDTAGSWGGGEQVLATPGFQALLLEVLACEKQSPWPGGTRQSQCF